MATLDIVKYGDPVLNKKCNSVSQFSDIKLVIENMFDSMYEAEGIGLAANQVGLNMNLFIIDVTHTDEAENTHVFINSEIKMDHVITVCNNANHEVCPIWPKKDQIIHWDIEDPVSKLINLNENEKNNIILNTFNVINEKIKNWIKNEE